MPNLIFFIQQNIIKLISLILNYIYSHNSKYTIYFKLIDLLLIVIKLKFSSLKKNESK